MSPSRSDPALWMVRANSVCRAVRFASGVVAEQPRQHQHRVQRRTQLVADVGQELRLVLRRLGQLLGLLLQPGAGQLDLAVLRLDVALLLGQQGRLLLQLGVGALQLGRLLLQFAGQPLRLGQQFLRTPVGLDRLERDADRHDEPVQEGQVQVGQGPSEANSMTPSVSPSNSTGSTTRSVGRASPSPVRMTRWLVPVRP